MADQVLGEALLEIRASQEKLVGDVAKIADTLVGALQKVEKQTESTGLSGLAKEIQEVARATDAAEKQIQNLKFAAIADEVGQLTSALKGAESGVQITEDLAKAEALLEERFSMVRAEIERQAASQRGLVDEEVLAEKTTLQLAAAQRQHDQALESVRGKALQAATSISKLEDEERAAAAAATKSWQATAAMAQEQQDAYEKAWEATAKLAQEQQDAETAARELAQWEAQLAESNKQVATTSRTAVDSLREMQGTLTGMGIALSAFSAAGVLAIRDAVGALREFEHELGAVDTLLVGETSVSIDSLRQELLSLDDHLGSAKDLTNALYQALSAGVEPAKGVAFVGDAAKLASAGLGNLTGTVDLLTTVLNAYGLQADQTTHISEVLFEAVKVGKTTIEELSGSLGRVIPTAKGLGVGIGDLSAVVAKLTTVGLNTEVAVTSLNAALVAIQSPTTEAEKVAAELGISFEGLRTTIRDRGLVAALEEIQKATGGNQQAIAKLIPAIEAQRAVFALMSGDVSKLNGFLADFNKEASAGGQVASAFEARAKTLDGAMAALAVSVDKAKINIATGLKVSLLDASEAARKALDDFNKLSAESQALAAQMGAVTVAVAGAAGASLLFLSRLPDMIQGFTLMNQIVPLSVGGLSAWQLSAAGVATGLGIVGGAAYLVGSKIIELSVDINEARAQNERLLESFQRLPPAMREAQAASGGVAIELGKQRAALAGVEEEMSVLRIQAENGNKATTSSGESMADLDGKAVRLRATIASLEGTLAKVNGQFRATTAAVIDTGSQFDEMVRSWKAWQVVAQDTGSQFDAMLINWEDANKAAEESKRKQKEAADETKRLAEANKQLQSSIDQLKLDAVADDLDAATKAMERSRTVVADESYLRALQDIQAQYEAQVAAAKAYTEEAVQGGADRSKAAEREALAVEQAQRDMADAVESLNAPLQTNVEWWGKLGDQILEMPDEVRAFIPTLDGIAAATGRVDEATFGLTQTTKDAKQEFQLAGQVTDDFAKSLVDLAVSGGKAEDVLKSLGSSVLNDLTSSITSGLGSMLKTGLADLGNMAAGGLADVLSPGVTAAASEAGMSGAEALVGTLTDGIASLAPDAIVAALGAGGTAAAIVAGVAGIGVGIAAAFGAFEGPTIQQQVARMLSKQIKKGFKDPEVFAAIDDGLESVGLYLGDGLGTVMVKAPKRIGLAVGEAFAELGSDSSYQFSDGFYQDMKEHGTQLIHSSIADVLHVFYRDITTDVATGIQQSAVAAGTAIAKELGFVGDKAIKFAQEWSIAFIGMMQQAGKGADEILTALHRIDSSLGTSQELIASFQRLQAAMIDAGVDMDALYAKINEQLKLITGKKMHVGNLEEVLQAVGGDATRALGVIENAMDLAGVSIAKFSGGLSDVVLAISNDAGTAIKEAGQDFLDFGNDADGTAEILRQKVLTALEDVITTAEKLGADSPEALDAFRTAVGLIPPEMLKSSDFVNGLRHDFARMAADSHMSVRELVDSIDPPIPAAMREAILATNDLGKALGDLSGAPLSSIKEITDRMKQFAGQLYTTVEEGGKQVKKLTGFGEQVVGDLANAVSGMWDTITEDGVIAKDEIAGVFGQLAMIPEDVFNDPAVQAAVHELLAKIGEQTGDATLIALAASSTITKEQLDQATKEYDQWVKDHPPPPPPATTPPTDGTTPTDGQPTDPTKDPTGAAAGAPPPQPIPPETTASYQTLADTATEYAKAVLAGRDAFEALTQGVIVDAAKILAAISPIYGTEDDEVSLAAIHKKLELITDDLLGWSGNWKDDFDKARGAIIDATTEVGNYAGALASIPTDVTTTITRKYVTEGDPNGGDTGGGEGGGPGMASGGWIPGNLGDPFPITAHGRELVVPADTATTLPPDLVAALLSGDAFTLPASMVARMSPSVAPMVKVASTASASAPGPAIDPEFTLVPVRRRDLAEDAVLEVARATSSGRARIDGRRFRVSPTYGRRRG